MTTFADKKKKHLSDWLRKRNPEKGCICGKYNYRGTVVKSDHILPLDDTIKYKKVAIVNAIRNYHVLTDGIEFNEQILPYKELHHLAHHLTSSQILCYNFFGLLLGINKEMCHKQIHISKALQEWLKIMGLPVISNNGLCVFEAVLFADEGTSFDFCVYEPDNSSAITFEIKFTEAGFGKASYDDRHVQKFDEIYLKKFLKSGCTPAIGNCDSVSMDNFFKYYQLFRNCIYAEDNKHIAVVIYPEENTACKSQIADFKSKYDINPNLFKDYSWEKALNAVPKTIQMDELRSKYGL